MDFSIRTGSRTKPLQMAHYIVFKAVYQKIKFITSEFNFSLYIFRFRTLYFDILFYILKDFFIQSLYSNYQCVRLNVRTSLGIDNIFTVLFLLSIYYLSHKL